MEDCTKIFWFNLPSKLNEIVKDEEGLENLNANWFTLIEKIVQVETTLEIENVTPVNWFNSLTRIKAICVAVNEEEEPEGGII